MQKALCLLEQETLTLENCSSLYETPPWGFESLPFYNAVAVIKTSLSPLELLEELLKIERQLGRIRATESTGYEARTIDLDLLLYNDVILESPSLSLPHPRLHLRNFVLDPLVEVAPQWVHPQFRKTMVQLRAESEDTATGEQLPFEHWTPPIFDFFPYLAIEGNIGAGKTTLTQKIAMRFGVSEIHELFSKNPHLVDFYENPDIHALAVESFFLQDRAQQLSHFWKHHKGKAVADYSFDKSLIFASQTLESSLFDSFQHTFTAAQKSIPTPDLILYLDTPVEQLHQQIRRRGRSFEQTIETSYLNALEKKYKQWCSLPSEYPKVILSTKGIDFEANEADFQCVLRAIFRIGVLRTHPTPPLQ